MLCKAEGLEDNHEWGKPLHGELAEYQSLRCRHYRIIYRYDVLSDVVWVVVVGIRKEGSKQDIYERALKLLRAGKLRLYQIVVDASGARTYGQNDGTIQ